LIIRTLFSLGDVFNTQQGVARLWWLQCVWLYVIVCDCMRLYVVVCVCMCLYVFLWWYKVSVGCCFDHSIPYFPLVMFLIHRPYLTGEILQVCSDMLAHHVLHERITAKLCFGFTLFFLCLFWFLLFEPLFSVCISSRY